jgi:hypothetical protein
VGTCQTIVLVRHFREQNLYITHGVDAELLLVRVGSFLEIFVKEGLTLTEAVA